MKTGAHILMLKIAATIYLVCFLFVYLTTNTAAEFIDIRTDKQVIQAGEWWDGSSLTFVDTDPQIINSCEPAELQIDIHNDSAHAMYGPATYEIYKVAVDSESHTFEIIEKVSDDIMFIDPMDAKETTAITHMIHHPGDYIFKVYQRDGDDTDKEAGENSIVSEVITVNCLEKAGEAD